METYRLICHPETLAGKVRSVVVEVAGDEPHHLTLRWRIDGAGDLTVPAPAEPERADGLWQTTCFELFLRSGAGDSYAEFNLSPSGQWAAYDFTAWREGMADRAMPQAPLCRWRGGGEVALFEAAVPLAGLPALPGALSLTAVIEEAGHGISYWALAHPPGRPDFHKPACFAASLAAPHRA